MAAHQFAREKSSFGNGRELSLHQPPVWRSIARSVGFGERHAAPLGRLTFSEDEHLALDLTGQAFRALPQRGAFDVALRDGRAGIAVPIGVHVALSRAVVSFSYTVTLTLGQWMREGAKAWSKTRSGALVRKAESEHYDSSVLFNERFRLPETRDARSITRVDLSVSYLLTLSTEALDAELSVQPLVHGHHACAIMLFDTEPSRPIHLQSASHVG